MSEWVLGIKDEGGFAIYESAPSNDGDDLVSCGVFLVDAFENGANDGSLPPDFAFGQLSGRCEASQFGTGSGATRRAIVGGPRAEDKVLRVRFDSWLGGGEALNVVDFDTVGSGDFVCLESGSDCAGEACQFLDVVLMNLRTLIGNEKEPVSTPGDVAGDCSVAWHVDCLIRNASIRRHIGNGDPVILMQGGGDDTDGSFDAMIPRGDPSEMGQGFDHPDGPVEASVKVGDVVEENDSGHAGVIGRFAKKGSHHRVKAPGFVNESGSNPVDVLTEEVASGRGSNRSLEARDHRAGRLAAGVGIDDFHGEKNGSRRVRSRSLAFPVFPPAAEKSVLLVEELLLRRGELVE